MSLFAFPKAEHLCGKTEFQLLFKEGKAYYAPFLTMLVRKVEADAFAVRVGVIVPKKKFHHAVDRNCMKRLLRESYRLQKPSLYAAFSEANFEYRLLLIFTGKELLPFSEVNRDVCMLLSRLKKTVGQQAD